MSVYFKDSPAELEKAIFSILDQTYSCDLFIYCDGELSPDLDKVIEGFISLVNVKVFRSTENLGLARALNKLISEVLKSDYDYVARMDSDDISRRHRIYEQVKFMESNKCIDVTGTSCHEFGASFALNEKHLPTEHKELFNFSFSRCPFIHPSVMFRSRVFSAGHRYPENTNLTEDMALWFELLESGCIFGNLNLVLLDYRLNESTLTRRQGLKKACSEVTLRTKYMYKLGGVSMKNVLLIGSRLLFHIMPPFLIKLLYRFAR